MRETLNDLLNQSVLMKIIVFEFTERSNIFNYIKY